MDDPQTFLVKGLFCILGGEVWIGGRSLASYMTPMIGHDVHISVSFVPPDPIDLGRWGGGCCTWHPHPCPAGHHTRPHSMLNVSLRGFLGVEDGKWWVDQVHGSRVVIPIYLMDGHYGMVTAVTVFDDSKMRESTPLITPESVEALGLRAGNLKDLLTKLKNHMGE